MTSKNIKSGEIKEIVLNGKSYPVNENGNIDFGVHGDIDELNLIGKIGDTELIETKTGRRFKVTFKITSSRYTDNIFYANSGEVVRYD